MKLVREDPSLVHKVVAPAGSTLLCVNSRVCAPRTAYSRCCCHRFGETLMHATGHISSNRERTIVTTGFGPTMFPYWDDQVIDLAQDRWHLSARFRSAIPDQYRTLFLGRRSWVKKPKYRTTLMQEAETGDEFGLDAWERALEASRHTSSTPPSKL